MGARLPQRSRRRFTTAAHETRPQSRGPQCTGLPFPPGSPGAPTKCGGWAILAAPCSGFDAPTRRSHSPAAQPTTPQKSFVALLMFARGLHHRVNRTIFAAHAPTLSPPPGAVTRWLCNHPRRRTCLSLPSGLPEGFIRAARSRHRHDSGLIASRSPQKGLTPRFLLLVLRMPAARSR
jgi:hypothetical protein